MGVISGSVAQASDIFGAWTAYTPTWTNLTVGNGTVTAAYKTIDKTVFVRIYLTFGSTTSVSGIFFPSLPVPKMSSLPTMPVMLFDSSTAAFQPGVLAADGYIIPASAGRCNATVPWTWATGDIISINGSYEAA